MSDAEWDSDEGSPDAHRFARNPTKEKPVPADEDDLHHRTGKASDLESQFEEILSEFAEQVTTLITGMPPSNFDEIKPEIEKSKQRLLDAVSNTVIMDAH